MPTATTVKDNYPNVRLLRVEDSLEYLVDQLVEYRRRMMTLDAIQDATNAISDSNDHNAALDVLRRTLATIDVGVDALSHDLDLTADPLTRWADYEERKNNPGGMLGIPTGIKTIDVATAGLQGGQLVVVVAPPKAGKSTLLVQMAKNMHDGGHVPYLQSFEMSNSEQQLRTDAMIAQVSHTRLMRGLLNSAEEKRYQQALTALQGKHQFILSDATTALTISAIQAKVQKFDPDVVFIDGVYLMMDEISGEMNTPQALTNITRNLKKMAQHLNKPVVISTQALLWKMRGGKVSAGSIGYSSSFFQDADVLMALERVGEGDDEDDSMRVLKILESRNCPKTEVDMIWSWEEGVFKEDDLGQAA